MTQKEEEGQSFQEPTVSLKEFFEKTPPGKYQKIQLNFSFTIGPLSLGNPGISNTNPRAKHQREFLMELPDLTLHCEAESCNGLRVFKPVDKIGIATFKNSQFLKFLTFLCRNCQKMAKTYSFKGNILQDPPKVVAHFVVLGKIRKFGEEPGFGPPTLPRVNTLIGPERDYFFKGRQAESQGLGIAAFAYYRRVVESQKDRIFDEIIKIVRKTNNSQALLDELESAKRQTQFSAAVDQIKHGIPSILNIENKKPLKLLHSALSQHLHDESDEDCLEIATDIRTVLFELAERLHLASKDDSALQESVKRLSKVRQEKPRKPTPG